MLQRRKYLRFMRRFARAREGVTAIEFAVIAPVMILLMFGIIEFSLMMLVSNLMESATAVSSRLGKTGYVESGLTREQTILQSVEDRAGDLINPDHLTVTSKFYDQFDQIGDGEPWNDANGNGTPNPGEWTDVNGNGIYDADLGAAGYGDAEDIVVYTVHYPWPIMTPILREILGGTDGTFDVTARAVVKNEPYDD